jgi:hypothetical protein
MGILGSLCWRLASLFATTMRRKNMRFSYVRFDIVANDAHIEVVYGMGQHIQDIPPDILTKQMIVSLYAALVAVSYLQ